MTIRDHAKAYLKFSARLSARNGEPYTVGEYINTTPTLDPRDKGRLLNVIAQELKDA